MQTNEKNLDRDQFQYQSAYTPDDDTLHTQQKPAYTEAENGSLWPIITIKQLKIFSRVVYVDSSTNSEQKHISDINFVFCVDLYET